jgi:FeS assembly SUF system protein
MQMNDKDTNQQNTSELEQFLNTPDEVHGLPTDQAQITGKVIPMTDPDIGRELAPIEVAVVKALKSVYDPEIPVDIYELGLIYGVEVDEPVNYVRIEMTLTAPGCPVAGYMPGWVEEAVLKVEGIDQVHVEMVWDPPWTMERMSEQAKLELNMF